jgi:hypothetical protein
MPKPDRRDVPDSQSRENAISSRAVEGFPDALGRTVAGILAEPVSNEHQRERDTQQETDEADDPTDRPPLHQTGQQAMGDVTPTAAVESPASPEGSPGAREAGEAIMRRLMKDRRWREISLVRDEMMRDAKKRLPDIEDRRAWVYSELDRMYPPVQAKPGDSDTGFVGTKGLREGLSDTYPKLGPAEGSDSGSIQGLSWIPEGWPELAMNASLAADVGWVQANRLRVVEERPGKATVVKLEQALAPAPSWAALGWLETSIRSYAKFVDVASKVSGGADDEGAVMRRERKSVDEVKALLKEMEADVCGYCGHDIDRSCPSCGRPV